MSLLQSAWEVFNAEDSWLPLLIPLLLWSSALAYCTLSPNATPFHEWNLLHNVHNAGAILIGVLSLYFDDDELLNERIQLFWNVSYFAVDLTDTLMRADGIYMFHAVATLGGGYLCMTNPLLMKVRVASRLSFLELSNPFRYLAVKTKKTLHSMMFFVVFTMVRVVYIPLVMRLLIENGMAWSDGPMVICLVIYSLQLWWWFKMWRIVIKMAIGKRVDHEIKEHYDKEE